MLMEHLPTPMMDQRIFLTNLFMLPMMGLLMNDTAVNITITQVNDPTVAVADLIQVNEGGTVTLTTTNASSVISNDTDAEK